jgi:hypothetical protein
MGRQLSQDNREIIGQAFCTDDLVVCIQQGDQTVGRMQINTTRELHGRSPQCGYEASFFALYKLDSMA